MGSPIRKFFKGIVLRGISHKEKVLPCRLSSNFYQKNKTFATFFFLHLIDYNVGKGFVCVKCILQLQKISKGAALKLINR